MKKYPRVTLYFGSKHENTLRSLNKLQMILNCSRADAILHLLKNYELDHSGTVES
jgi:hypothetical protein